MEETRKTVRRPRAAAPKPAARKAPPAAKSSARKAAAKPAAPGRAPSPVERDELVRTAAYLRAERRGFEPGHEWDDWLAAEAEVMATVGAPRASKGRKAPARKPARG